MTQTVTPTAPTITELFARAVDRWADRTAFQVGDGDGWQAITFAEYGAVVRAVAGGLAAEGFAADEFGAIICSNRPEWHEADFGLVNAGLVSCPIYPTNAPSQVAYILTHSEAVVVFVEDEVQRAKVEAVRADCPALRRCVVIDDSTGGAGDDFYLTWSELARRGDEHLAAHPQDYDDRRGAAGPDDLLAVTYTSGTTGPPKGTMLSHHNAVFTLAALDQVMSASPEDRKLSFLPLSHVAERASNPQRCVTSCCTPRPPRALQRPLDPAHPTRLALGRRPAGRVHPAAQPAAPRHLNTARLTAGLRPEAAARTPHPPKPPPATAAPAPPVPPWTPSAATRPPPARPLDPTSPQRPRLGAQHQPSLRAPRHPGSARGARGRGERRAVDGGAGEDVPGAAAGLRCGLRHYHADPEDQARTDPGPLRRPRGADVLVSLTRDFTLIPDDAPGVLARLGEAAAAAGISIAGISAFTGEGKGLVHVLVEDAQAALDALTEAGFDVRAARDVLVVEVEDRPGALGAVCRRLADGGVNVQQAYTAGGSRLVLAVDDLETARGLV